ncbi:MAG TPA: D-sedoheptulose 7-phosphate isomerase [Candidatus Polarisedimenticolaceae bacterium]|nr:D-sedoheptulose 7-phosphate isomerase [Candidatus Polarisedimenticolaceae bacterium]
MRSATDVVARAFDDHRRVMDELARVAVPSIVEAGERIAAALRAGGKLLAFGNGGSAADAQHLAAEIVGRFRRERAGLPAIALTTDTSILTAVANDYGFDEVFARQVRALGAPGDVVLALSTSGASANVLRALDAAAEIGAFRIGLAGRGGGPMRARCDLALIVPGDDTARIQEAHITIVHALCELIDDALGP